jgi:hypothetical protein
MDRKITSVVLGMEGKGRIFGGVLGMDGMDNAKLDDVCPALYCILKGTEA